MVGEEEVTSYNEYNDLPESKGQLVPLTANGNFERRPHLPKLKLWRPPKVRTEALRGFTYFIKAGNSIKIGSSAKFEQRLKSLQTAHAKPLVVLAVVPAKLAPEFEVHQLFAGLRTRGEWFRADRELLHFIAGVKAEAAILPVSEQAPKISALSEIDLTFEANRSGLMRMGAAAGWNTQKGHLCSVLIEQMQNMRTYVRPEWATHEIQTLPYQIKKMTERLAALR